MNDTWNVKVVVVPPDGVGRVLLAGAAAVVTEAMEDMGLDYDYYMEETDPDGAGMVMVDLIAGGRSDHELEDAITAAVQELIRTTPELGSWGYRVVVGPPNSGDTDAADLDEEASHLVPSGDDLAEGLLHAIAHERSVYDDAGLFAAYPVEDLSEQELDSLSAAQREVAVRRATALAGCLIQASEVVIDNLFQDIEDLRRMPEDDPFDVTQSMMLSTLPARFSGRYTTGFAQRFLVALVDVTVRLTRGWAPLACVAQELGLRVLLDEVEVIAEAADVELEDGWREHVEELLFEDADHEMLYDMSLDGIEDVPSLQAVGIAPMRFDDWFTPFNDQRSLPPYAMNRPQSL